MTTSPLLPQASSQTQADHPPSSSAFGTPIHPIRPRQVLDTTRAPILPISLPPSTLRPLAFRTFTKKHNLTLTSSALQIIATFIGTHCGSGWREEGLAEKVLDEAAKAWKRNGGSAIIPGENNDLSTILGNIEGCMTGGRIVQRKTLSHQNSLTIRSGFQYPDKFNEGLLERADSQGSVEISNLHLADDNNDQLPDDPRAYLRVISAFEQPQLTYNVIRKHFETIIQPSSFLPDSSHRTKLFRNRYNLIHQRLLRNEAFQTSTVPRSFPNSLQRTSSATATSQQSYKLTPVANLLGRSGSSHVLLGLLVLSPTGTLALGDLTGSITLDLQYARPVPKDGAWFTPGMIVLVEGMYEEEGSKTGPGLNGDSGVGGTIGGKFLVLSMGGPPCERRDVTLDVNDARKDKYMGTSAGFGWIDFLGVGSEKANGRLMRNLEREVLQQRSFSSCGQDRGRVVVIGEVNLDGPKTLQALQKVLALYAMEPTDQKPMTFVLIGNFTRYAVLTGGGSGGSVEYKEYFDSLASMLSEFPMLLQESTFVFVPGDNDPWASAFSAGASVMLPKRALPEIFTSRVKRVFGSANATSAKSTGRKPKGEAIWSSNPSRLSLFGPVQEVVIFRDDMIGRLRRKALRFQPVEELEICTTDPTAGIAKPEHLDDSGRSHVNRIMQVDHAVESAESHIPAPNAKPTAGLSAASDLNTARKLVKTILDQGYLSPFPLSDRPTLWDYGGALTLYPVPTALILMDPEAPPFALTYEGCHAMNPGPLIAPGKTGKAQWIEYDARTRKGTMRELRF